MTRCSFWTYKSLDLKLCILFQVPIKISQKKLEKFFEYLQETIEIRMESIFFELDILEENLIKKIDLFEEKIMKKKDQRLKQSLS